MLKVKSQLGFTLLELMLVIALLAVLSTLATDFYTNFQRGSELEAASKSLARDIKRMRESALSGLSDNNWGVHMVNGATDYYEVFSSPTDYVNAAKIISATTSLPQNIYFSLPAEGVSQDILFSKIAATTTATSISLISRGATSTIKVSAFGGVE